MYGHQHRELDSHKNTDEELMLEQLIIIIIITIIIIALSNAPYKMLHKLKSACSIRKNQLWTSVSSSVSQKSRDQLSDPSSQLIQ